MNEKQNGWSIHRKNRTSGKSGGAVIATGLSEYNAKMLAMDANAGKSCFRYTVFDPDGQRWSFERRPDGIGSWVKI